MRGPDGELTIMLVEDEWLVRTVLAEDLRGAGCRVEEAESGEAAVALLRQGFRPAVLVTDIQLSGEMTGWDVAEAWRSRDPDIRVIYTSGNTPIRERCVDGSVFIGKPCDPSAVMRACRGPGDARPTAREFRPSA